MTIETEQDRVARQIIYVAKYMGLSTPRTAAEHTLGRVMSNEEWEAHKEPFERNWDLVPDPNSLGQKLRRLFGAKHPYNL